MVAHVISIYFILSKHLNSPNQRCCNHKEGNLPVQTKPLYCPEHTGLFPWCFAANEGIGYTDLNPKTFFSLSPRN